MTQETQQRRALSLLIHGSPKTGKSTMAAGGPRPVLILDAEGGSRFLRDPETRQLWSSRMWDPLLEAPPVPDGTWELCVVLVRDYQTVLRVYQWLGSGQHPFRSFSCDSISEIQQRCVDAIAGVEPMNQQKWGDLFRQVSTLVRQIRDLTFHPTNPLEVVTVVAMGREIDGRWRPYVQGQLGTTLPYHFDAYGAMFASLDANGTPVRYLVTSPYYPQWEAGDRTGVLPPFIENPTISKILDLIYNPQPAANGQAPPAPNELPQYQAPVAQTQTQETERT